MRRHIERNDIVLLAMKLEFSRVMALVAVEDQQPVFTLRTRRCMVVEVLDPIEAYSIGCPAVVRDRDTLVGWKIALGILVGDVVVRPR